MRASMCLSKKVYPRRFIERNIGKNSWRVRGRLHGHLILNPQRRCSLPRRQRRRCMALHLPPFLLLLQDPIFSVKFPNCWHSMLMTWRERTCSNFTAHLIDFQWRKEESDSSTGSRKISVAIGCWFVHVVVLWRCRGRKWAPP